MNDKQTRFVAEYLKDLNATQAAERAGYSKKTAYAQGQRLLKDAEICAAVTQAKARQLQQADISAVQVLAELAKLSFSNVQSLFDEAGNLKPIQSLTPAEAACIASLEVVKKNIAAGDGQVDVIHKVKVWDKTRSLEMLAKHFGLLVEKLEHSGELTIKHEL